MKGAVLVAAEVGVDPRVLLGERVRVEVPKVTEGLVGFVFEFDWVQRRELFECD